MTKNLIIATLAILVIIFGVRSFLPHDHEACAIHDGESVRKHDGENPHEHDSGDHSHVAPHGGCLNEIGSCETGHAEVLLNDNRIEVYLLAGGHEVDRSVRVAAPELPLTSWAPDGSVRRVTLKPEPLDLAGEKPGDCSHFVGSADWLTPDEEFDAYGWLMFRGAVRPIVIHYPQGHFPSHEAKGSENPTE